MTLKSEPGPLADKYTVSPFTVLDMASGPWQEIKRGWLRTGIRSEEGRNENLLRYSKKILQQGGNGTSAFDPVLCELAYKWFSPPRGQVVDPFAGGSVRGIVAGCMDRRYWGCDLSEKQIKANREQADEINKIPGALPQMPEWVVGDSRIKLDGAPEADFLFSCPPYGDKEEYSDDESDLSAMDTSEFLAAYKDIIAKSVAKLRDNSFACFVVGDYRDSEGYLVNLPCHTSLAFEAAGARLYSSAILRMPIGNAAMRAERNFTYRKLTNVHQNVLVFCKGNWKEAAAKAKRLEGQD